MAITTYATLKTALTAWMVRTGDTDFTNEEDTFIQLAEAKFNRKLRMYQRDTTATINTDASGNGTLPSDFYVMRSLYYSTSATGAPLTQVTWEAIQANNPLAVSGIPNNYAISGTKFRVQDVADGDFIVTYQAGLPTLVAGANTSNWLLVKAPDAYLDMCKAQGYAFLQDWQNEAIHTAKAMGILDDLGVLSDLATLGNAEMVIPGPTP